MTSRVENRRSFRVLFRLDGKAVRIIGFYARQTSRRSPRSRKGFVASDPKMLCTKSRICFHLRLGIHLSSIPLLSGQAGEAAGFLRNPFRKNTGEIQALARWGTPTGLTGSTYVDRPALSVTNEACVPVERSRKFRQADNPLAGPCALTLPTRESVQTIAHT